MPHSLRAYLSKARYEGHITDEQYKKYIRTLDRHKANEDAIEQIRAEIEDLDRYYDNDYFSTNNCPMYKCNEVLLIIDKYGKGEQE